MSELTNDALDHYHMKALSEKGLVDLRDWLEQHENTTNTHLVNDDTLDFTIGDNLEDWPRYGDDGTIRCISGSSISVAYGPAWSDGFEKGRFVDDGAIHLPPTDEFRKDDIEDRIDLSERFFMHFGTTNDLAGFGGINPAPEGIITPHIHVVEDATFAETSDVIEQALAVYESSVYEEGENVLLEKP